MEPCKSKYFILKKSQATRKTNKYRGKYRQMLCNEIEDTYQKLPKYYDEEIYRKIKNT